MRLNIQTDSALHTAQNSCVIIAHVCGVKHELEVLAQLLGVISKQLIVYCGTCSRLNAEISVAIFIQLIAAIYPVKVITDSHTGLPVRPQAVAASIRLSAGIKVKHQICGDRFNHNTQVRYIYCKGLYSFAACNCQCTLALSCGFEAPNLLSAPNVQSCFRNTIYRQFNGSCAGRRVIHCVFNRHLVVLLCLVIGHGATDNRCIVTISNPHDIFLDYVGFYLFAVDICRHTDFQQMATVFLCRNAVSHLSPGRAD